MPTAQRSTIGAWTFRTALALGVLAAALVVAGAVGGFGGLAPGGLIASGVLLLVSATLVFVAHRAEHIKHAHIVEVERFNRLFSALSHINQAIVRAPTRDELFSKVCLALGHHGGFRMAWVAWHDAGRKQVANNSCLRPRPATPTGCPSC